MNISGQFLIPNTLSKAKQELCWFHEPTRSNENFTAPKWFSDGKINISTIIDRHAEKTPNKTALSGRGHQDQLYSSYKILQEKVSKLANGLKEIGISKGDRVCIYMPMIPEAAFAMFVQMQLGQFILLFLVVFLRRQLNSNP